MNIPLIGCGVIGLTCGIRLLEQGHTVTIFAKDLPPHTTSNWAAAIWFPYKAYPEDKVLAWSKISYDECYKLADDPQAGIRDTILLQVFGEKTADPWWLEAVRNFRRPTAAELPAGFADGYIVTVPVIDTRVHMAYLVNRFQQLGGQINQIEITDLDELDAPDNLIINCAGLGSRQLVNDEAVYPIRGQIVRVKSATARNSYLSNYSATAATYVIPRLEDVILGGTAVPHDWNEEPNPETAAAILANAHQLAPELGDIEILEHGVGLRPGRHEVRLEEEVRPNGRVIIHNYGHGGAGFTLSWGCAAEVVDRVQQGETNSSVKSAA